VPTVVEVNVSISRTEETASLAKANVDQRAARVITLAKEFGVAATEIRASDLSVSPRREYRNDEYQHIGYSADLQVDIRLREIKSFPKLLGMLIDVPVDRILSITPKLEDESAANQAALATAIEDAKGKAATIAQQFGVQLGNVYSIVALPKEEHFYIGGAASRASQEDACFEPGTIAVEGRIEVTFYLAEPDPR
jgi:uncharacterized protein YggE